MSIRNTIGRGLALIMLGTGAFAAVGSAPAAAAPDCIVTKSISHEFNHIIAEADYYCESTGESGPWPVDIQKNVSGTWLTVASGTGTASYACVGTTTRSYRTGPLPVKDAHITAPCG